MAATHPTDPSTPTLDLRWRTRDIVVAAVIGVAFGVAFVLFGGVWRALDGLGPFQNILYGAWLLPAIVAPLIIRKPGAALFAELVAAGLSAFLGSSWGVDALVSGLIQGAGAEAVFFLARYRTWSLPVLGAAGLASSTLAFIHDTILWYQGYATDVLVIVAVTMAISGAILLPITAVAIVRALRQAGVLEGFPV
jgi:energy-coupling factor transport system substrate-specific component